MAREAKAPDSGNAAETAAKSGTESVYEVTEFAGNAAHLFGERANADLVTAAFKVAGRQEATLSEAKDIVEKFMKREVR